MFIEDFGISADGNNNGRLEPGETGEFQVSISNGENGIETEVVGVSVSSEDTTLIVWTEEIDFPNISPGQERLNEDAIIIEVTGDARPHTTWITVNISAEPGHVRLEKTYEMIIGFPRVLLIDDDDGQNIETYYTGMFDAIEEGWVRWDVLNQDSPDAFTLGNYDVTVWITGRAEDPLNELDRVQIELAAENGSNIILVGKKIGDIEDNRELLREYFGAEHEEDSTDVRWVRGLPGERPVPIDDMMFFADNQGNGDGRFSPSTMTPVNGADSLLVYLDRDQLNLGCAGVFRYDERRDAKFIYIGYSFAGGSGYHGYTEPYIVMQHMIEWMAGDHDAPFDKTSHPLQFSLEPAFPNPFNGRVNIGFTIPKSGSYRLFISDLHGREITALGSGFIPAGNYSETWNALDMPSGIYFARLIAPGYASIERKLVLVK